MRIMSFTVAAHRDNRGIVSVFQNRGMSCRAAEKKKRRRLGFWDVTDPGIIERRAISGVGVRGFS